MSTAPNPFCENPSTAGDACGWCDGCLAEVERLTPDPDLRHDEKPFALARHEQEAEARKVYHGGHAPSPRSSAYGNASAQWSL